MRVGLFVTCLIDVMRPEIGFSAIKLLESAGCEVVVPASQTCCGQPAYSGGNKAAARELAEKFLNEFESFDYIVIPSGSCGGTIKTHYDDLFAGHPALLERLAKIKSRVYELTDFLCRRYHHLPRVVLKERLHIMIHAQAYASWVYKNSRENY